GRGASIVVREMPDARRRGWIGRHGGGAGTRTTGERQNSAHGAAHHKALKNSHAEILDGLCAGGKAVNEAISMFTIGAVNHAFCDFHMRRCPPTGPTIYVSEERASARAAPMMEASCPDR